MAPRLRVLLSSPSAAHPPTAPCPVNSPTPTKVTTDGFDGEISVWVKGFEGDERAGDGSEYFGVRGAMTYAIVVRGRFTEQVSADELMFGNVFEKPIRDSLPWGTSVAQKAIYFVEPTLEMDLYADRPWALSPALASMNHLALTEEPQEGPIVKEDSVERIKHQCEGEYGASDYGAGEHCASDYGPSDYGPSCSVLPRRRSLDRADVADNCPPEGGDEKAQAAARKRWMTDKANREKISLNHDTHVSMEFCNGYLDFNTLSLSLPAGFNMTFPLLKYWDGQPVTYVCQRRGTSTGPADGKVFWSVAFEIVDEEAKRELEKRGGVKEEDKKVLQDAGKVGNEEMPQATEENDDDVD
ncbi:hypothetical protein EHS25_002727 [Saitozyma podzolica]|uniref:Domain of unknown function at the cortex 1 domain-containing protein n=1 Tax=Saitozyma podzolica TaxID=1890683 RepID=A0A427YD25_9TREE|nr:hypothetical protein EHS25_002727 [Saitozyma podzolica]